ncbi:MAG: hypothetical protein H8E89_05045 [Candidatus Nitrosopelagicus sp.]|jgi:hypothetical protein|nr:hypothetical protein [Candidatus Nitrosopelagicus sp.]
MNQGKKISLSVLIAVIISVFLFFTIMFSLPDHLFQSYEDFFSSNLGDEDKIFILGSSHVYAINPIIVSDKLKESNYEFDVYNLGSPGDDFEERERAVDMMIKNEPKIVMFGIEPRSFESAGRTITELPNNPLPQIPSINEFFNILDLGDKKGIIKNPKFALIRTISSPMEKEIEEHPYPNSPFLKYEVDAARLSQSDELEKIKPEYVGKINSIEKNSNLHALNNIIKKLEENDIKVIIFVTPHSKFYLDKYPELQRNVFQDILDEISRDNKIYSLYEKYAEDNVWHDHTHLAANDETKFYSEDIADFIIKELER